MLLPYGDEPNDPKRVPWMNYALIGANIAVFLLTYMRGPLYFRDVLDAWAFQPGEVTIPTIFSSMFLHVGWLHLAGNMLFLWIFGDNIEARLGSFGYLAAYLAVGAAATLIYGQFNEQPAVGASGAISGVQGLYFIACPKHRVKVFVWFYFFITVLHVKARWIMLFWFVMQDLIPTLISMNVHVGDGVAHLAHLGGFVAGLALMLVLKPMVKQIHIAAAAEFARTHRYTGGRAASRRYERTRRRDPYRPGAYKKPEDRSTETHSFVDRERREDDGRRIQ